MFACFLKRIEIWTSKYARNTLLRSAKILRYRESDSKKYFLSFWGTPSLSALTPRAQYKYFPFWMVSLPPSRSPPMGLVRVWDSDPTLPHL